MNDPTMGDDVTGEDRGAYLRREVKRAADSHRRGNAAAWTRLARLTAELAEYEANSQGGQNGGR